jgi:hypothetical protein
MIFAKQIILIPLFFFSIDLLAQCDSAFYYFKRAVITKVSDHLYSDLKIKTPEKTVKLEFSDYQRFSYTISDPKSTLGFACVRNKACNNYFDSLCIKNTADREVLSFERTLFENFMSSGDLKICDSTNYLHTLVKLIENPIDGWSKLERYYFRFANNNDLEDYYPDSSVSLTIPVYIFLDKKLRQTFFYTVMINGTQKKNILIERKQKITNK